MQDDTSIYPSQSITISPAEIVETYIAMVKGLGLDEAQKEFKEVNKHMDKYQWWKEHVQPCVYQYFMECKEREREAQLELARASAAQVYNVLPSWPGAVQQQPTTTTAPRQRKATQADEHAIRQALVKLLQAPYENGKEKLFNQKSHWQAVFRILADLGFFRASDFDGFDVFIRPLVPEECITEKTAYSYASVKQISQTDFGAPFSEWKFDAETSNRRKPFVRMQEVGRYFQQCLAEFGVMG